MNSLEQHIQLNQKQQLRMSGEQLQSLRILQMTHAELAEYIAAELLENPVLEEPFDAEGGAEDLSADELQERIERAAEDQTGDLDHWDRYGERGQEPDASAYEKYVCKEETLQDHLLEQLKLSNLAGGAYRACEYLICNMDEDGYLLLDDEVREEIAKECFANPWDIELALKMVQSMDPAGVGCGSLEECLELQLERSGRMTEQLRRLIREMLPDIAENRIGVIAQALGVSKKEAQRLSDLIRGLEPKPGRRFSDGRAVQHIVPDVIVELRGEHVVIYSNERNLPRLRISSYYRDLIPEVSGDKELIRYLTDRFQAADRLIQSIDQRRDTIIRVTEAILKHQHPFFTRKGKFLLPLTYREIAEELGLHVSTISRAVDGKYMQVAGTVYSFRHFFGSGISQGSEQSRQAQIDSPEVLQDPPADVFAGEEGSISAASVRGMIRGLIETEDPKKPLSDQKITDILQADGLQISRRTVAKYREAEGIPSTSKRRRY